MSKENSTKNKNRKKNRKDNRKDNRVKFEYTKNQKRYLSRYPLKTPAYLVVRIAAREIVRAASGYFKGKLLDIGCGAKWKEDLVGEYVDEYIGLDHEGTRHDKSNIDLFGTAYDIPAEDETFDSVICTAVLEHLEEPSDALTQCRRVLKKGGHALFTVPLSWHLHEEPRDFYRYTKYGLTYLLEKNRFNIVEITPLGGFWVIFGTNCIYYIRGFRRFRRINPLRWLVTPLTVFFHGFTHIMNKFDRPGPFTWMYLVVVRK